MNFDRGGFLGYSGVVVPLSKSNPNSHEQKTEKKPQIPSYPRNGGGNQVVDQGFYFPLVFDRRFPPKIGSRFHAGDL